MIDANTLADLDLSPKPWFPQGADVERLVAALGDHITRENWKYTPIDPFVAAYAANCAKQTEIGELDIDGVDQPGVIVLPFAGLSPEALETARSALASLDLQRYPTAQLAVLNARSAALVKVCGTVDHPLTFRPASPEQVVVFDFAPGSRASIVEIAEQRAYANTVMVLRLGAGCHVQHARGNLHAEPMHQSLLSVTVSEDAGYELEQYLVGGNKRRADVHVALEGARAEVRMMGAFVTEDGTHLDQQLVVEHRAADTKSTQTFHGIGLGKSRSVFNGRIHIHRGARGSDARLTNKNLALGGSAEIDTKPELEIYNDDVKCAHGATVGQLDEGQLFYLRTRGLAEPDARSLLCNAFLRSCIAGPLSEPVTRRLMDALG